MLEVELVRPSPTDIKEQCTTKFNQRQCCSVKRPMNRQPTASLWEAGWARKLEAQRVMLSDIGDITSAVFSAGAE